MFFNEVRKHLGADTFAQSAAKTQQRTLTQWAMFSGARSGGGGACEACIDSSGDGAADCFGLRS